MDIATVIGLVGGTILVAVSILIGGTFSVFINIPGLLIVIGGTIATTFIKFTMDDIINSIRVAMKAFMVKIDPPEEIMEKMVSVAKVAKERGLMALESEKPDDEFAAKAFQFLADGFDEQQIKELLQKDINLTIQRHTTGRGVFKGMGGVGTGFWNDWNPHRPRSNAREYVQTTGHRSGHGDRAIDHPLWRADSQSGMSAPG